jgi:hypothetical protein
MGLGKFRDSFIAHQVFLIIFQKFSNYIGLVCNFLKNPVNYGKSKRSGRKPSLSKRDQRQIIRLASNSTRTCRQIAAELGLKVSRETIRRVINKSKFICPSKMKKAPQLNSIHKYQRRKFARENMSLDWSKVV